MPGVRKGDMLVQVILAAITNNPHHFSNLIQVFSPYVSPGSFHLVDPPVPRVCVQAEENVEKAHLLLNCLAQESETNHICSY